MAHCSVWSNATSASRKNFKTTFPKCSLCSRTRASLEMPSDRSCVSMPKNTTFSRSHASCLWVTFVVSRSCSPHHCYDGTSRMDSWWIECTKSSSTKLTPAFDGLESPFPQLDALEMKTLTNTSLPKLLGNSGYGKTGTNVDRHRDVKYCTEIGTSALINNKRFRQLDVVTEDAYEIEMNKSVVKYTLPLHIGFFVYQYAKLRMLQFYYDFVDRYVERPLFQYCEMDTDSAYIALAGESIDGLVRADRRAHYFRNRSQWLPAECCDEHEDDYVCARIAGLPWTVTESCCFARKAFDKRTPGLFKVEWRGDGFIGLCSKTYYCFGATDKYSTKGLSKRHNDIDKDTFLTVLKNRRSGGGFNRGFRVRDSSVMTYIQERAALTYFYGKRKVLPDGLSTAPLEV